MEDALVEVGSEESLPMRAALARTRASLFGADVQPTRLGRFELLRVLGRGASGVVHRAHDPKLGRDVALKVYPKHADAELARRIKREARVSAGLDHPNIVTVFDTGEEGGRLWVAMELVEGETLRSSLAKGPKTWSTWKPVVLSIARGIEAAHRLGVVHRDIKPENILLGADGRVAVADFGLAALAPTTAPGETSVTSAGGTPAYMSPEQLQGTPPGPASDQFSYCVTVFEAVVGHRPFQAGSPDAMLRAMRSGPVAALERAPLPGRLSRVLRRGLALDPADRFPSMTALVSTLEHNRRWWPAVVGTALAAGAVAVVVGGESQTCTGGADELAKTWNDARRTQVAQAFTKVGGPLAVEAWSRVEPRVDARAREWVTFRDEACRRAPDARTLDAQMRCLDAQRAKIDATLRAFERVSPASVQHSVAMVNALESPVRCALPSEPAPTDARSVALRDAVLEAGVAVTSGEHAAAESMAREAVVQAEALGQGPARARALVLQGAALLYQGKPATSLLEEAHAQAVEVDDGETQLHAALLASTASASDRESSERWLRTAEALVARIEAPPRLRVLTLDRRGALAGAAGQFDAARASFEEARSVIDAEGLQDTDLGARVGQNSAQIAMLQGRIEEAIEQHRRVLEIRKRVLGPHHPTFGTSLAALGTTLVHAKVYDEAEPVLQRALAVFSASVGEDHIYAHKTRLVLAAVLHLRGSLDAARAEYDRILTALERDQPEGGRETIVVLSNLADIAVQQQRLDDAAHAQDRVVELSRRFDRDTVGFADQLEAMGEIRQLQGRHADALRLFEEAADVEEPLLGAEDPLRLGALLGIGVNARAQGRATKAREALERAVELGFEDGADSVDRARAELELARTLLEDDVERAGRLVRRARQRLDALPSADVDAATRAGLLSLEGLGAFTPEAE